MHTVIKTAAAASAGALLASSTLPAAACDINSATDVSCGAANINPLNPLSPSNPANQANLFNNYPQTDVFGNPVDSAYSLRFLSALANGASVAPLEPPYAYPYPVGPLLGARHPHHRRHRYYR